jgi:D-apiose dehydrogenase
MAARNPLRVALAGAGMISPFHLAAWRRLGERARVVAICDPDLVRAGQRAEEFAVREIYPSVEALLAAREVDALDISSPRASYAAIVELAASRGIDALCQKPLASSLAEAEALISRVGGRIRVMAHENWRFRPWYRELKAWLAAGDIGEVLSLQLTTASSGLLLDDNGRRPALVRQPFMAEERRLLIAEDLIHHLDLVRWLAGPLRVVSARAARTLAEVAGETLATILLETASGAPIVVSGALVAPGFPSRGQDKLELIGRHASATFAQAELRLLGPQPRTAHYDADASYQASFDGTIAHFAECLASGAAFETDAVDNLETLRLVEHAYLAAGLRDSWGAAPPE